MECSWHASCFPWGKEGRHGTFNGILEETPRDVQVVNGR